MVFRVFPLLVLLTCMNVAVAQDPPTTAPDTPLTPGTVAGMELGPVQDAGPGLLNNGATSAPSLQPDSSTPFYNLLSAPEEPGGGAFIQVKSSSPDVGLLVYGRVSIDTVTSNGRLLAPYGYIFLAPGTPERPWTNVISARQSTLGFLFTGPNIGDFKTLARFETYFLNNVIDANVYGLAQYYL